MTIVNFGHLQGNWRQPISLEADRCGPPSRFAFQLFPSGGLTSTPQGPRLPLALFSCLAGLGTHQPKSVATTMPGAGSVLFVRRSSWLRRSLVVPARSHGRASDTSAAAPPRPIGGNRQGNGVLHAILGQRPMGDAELERHLGYPTFPDHVMKAAASEYMPRRRTSCWNSEARSAL